MTHTNYPAKLLLFGEYTVLAGSRALAVPLKRWSGHWERSHKQDHSLIELRDHILETYMAERFDADSFTQDVTRGLQFKSTIPQGFGLGSSAALTAAVYDNYVSKNSDLPIEDIVRDLATIEGHYHGHSSGMDPLVSYLGKPVLREGKEYASVELPSGSRPSVFLINSGIGRFTAPLVELFKSRLQEDDYVKEIIEPLIVHVDHAIQDFLDGSWDMFYEHLQVISQVEFERFKEMLPEPIEFIWKQVKSSPNLCLKLCGAGGGGYFLGFAKPGVDIEAELGVSAEVIEL